MASRSNPYAPDPYLQQGFSNLSRALIGSAADDANVAMSKYRDAQTVGQNQDNAMSQQLYDAGQELSQNPQFQSSILQALGINSMGQNVVGPPEPGQIRLGSDAAGNLARSVFGTYGNANQMSSAFDNIGKAKTSRLAEGMILGGTDKQAGRGALLLQPGGGKYQNPGLANQELQANDATARSEDNLRFGPGGQGDRDTAAQEATKIATNQADNTTAQRQDDMKFGPGGQGDRDNDTRKAYENYRTDAQETTKRANKGDDIEFQKWKHNNRDIEITVEPGKQVVVNPAAGKLLGLQPNNDGLYILDGGPKPGSVTVKVGKEDVYLDEATAAALGIEKNDDGQYVIPGDPELRKQSSKSSDSDLGNVVNFGRFQDQFKQTFEEMGDSELPNFAIGGMQTVVYENIVKDMKPQSEGGRGMTYAQAYSANVVPIISRGSVEISTTFSDGISDFSFPRYFLEFFRSQPQLNTTAAANFIQRKLGYSAKEADAVIKQIQAQ
jgi:hypothetical protein